jgi:hypothetical protein
MSPEFNPEFTRNSPRVSDIIHTPRLVDITT